ncbi:MAG: dephospho-CoA kinase [Pirellulales bacterium]
MNRGVHGSLRRFPMLIGLTGGVASGKSLAAKYLAELGAVVLDADRAGHQVLREPEVIDALVERWGPNVIGPTGDMDRGLVADRVFGDSPQAVGDRRFLEDLLHPRIRARLEAERTHQAAHDSQVFVLDAPLLLESHWDAACDMVIFVDAPVEQRYSRAAGRGWTPLQFAQREAAQWPVERKRQHADWVLANAGTPEELQSQVHQFWQEHVAPR